MYGHRKVDKLIQKTIQCCFTTEFNAVLVPIVRVRSSLGFVSSAAETEGASDASHLASIEEIEHISIDFSDQNDRGGANSHFELGEGERHSHGTILNGTIRSQTQQTTTR